MLAFMHLILIHACNCPQAKKYIFSCLGDHISGSRTLYRKLSRFHPDASILASLPDLQVKLIAGVQERLSDMVIVLSSTLQYPQIWL